MIAAPAGKKSRGAAGFTQHAPRRRDAALHTTPRRTSHHKAWAPAPACACAFADAPGAKAPRGRPPPALDAALKAVRAASSFGAAPGAARLQRSCQRFGDVHVRFCLEAPAPPPPRRRSAVVSKQTALDAGQVAALRRATARAASAATTLGCRAVRYPADITAFLRDRTTSHNVRVPEPGRGPRGQGATQAPARGRPGPGAPRARAAEPLAGAPAGTTPPARSHGRRRGRAGRDVRRRRSLRDRRRRRRRSGAARS